MGAALKLMDLMVGKGCHPSVVCLSSMINGYCNVDKAAPSFLPIQGDAI